MTGMNALRFRGQDRLKTIKYELCMYNKQDLSSLLSYLNKNNVRYWIHNGDLYTRDSRFNETLKQWLEGEE